ncbi:rhomboid family intramembrane serine protease [Microscilla marina]|uniref:Rhomboid family protein n=1 Tax=Microscilla marina ATCC 23134 TaxID=313606 RepID=A1ZJ05_MICM2|nr:rhomboid family intramembrane serine protease [Microscilla marina]EAY29541.1 rhomboid family protein [Microscilla marina ATCC 23134]
MGNLTPIVRGLLIINVFVFFADSFISKDALSIYGTLWYVEFPEFKPWQLLTHMFLHADFFHLLGNMMGLFFFGPWLEQNWGARNFFIFYFACGFGGAAFQMVSFNQTYSDIHPKIEASQKEIKTHHKAILYVKKNPTPKAYAEYLKKYSPEIYKKEQDFLKSAFAAWNTSLELEKKDTSNLDEAAKQVLLKQKSFKEHFVTQIKRGASNREKEFKQQYSKMSDKYTWWRSQGYGLKMLGASGAIFGILIAFALFFPNVKMMLLFFPVPIKAKYFVAIYMVFTLYAAGGGNVGMANVAHLAHLGGAIVGFILARFWLWKYKYN